VENQIDKKIKMLCFDNGDEFAPRNLMHFVNYMELLNNLQIFIPNNKNGFSK